MISTSNGWTVVLRSTAEDRLAALLAAVYATIVLIHASAGFAFFIGLLLPILVLQLVLLFHVYFSLTARFGVLNTSEGARGKRFSFLSSLASCDSLSMLGSRPTSFIAEFDDEDGVTGPNASNDPANS